MDVKLATMFVTPLTVLDDAVTWAGVTVKVMEATGGGDGGVGGIGSGGLVLHDASRARPAIRLRTGIFIGLHLEKKLKPFRPGRASLVKA
jgi:hypothetical protein